MKNQFFSIEFDRNEGLLTGLSLTGDPMKANFVKKGKGFFALRGVPWCLQDENKLVRPNVPEKYALESFSESETGAEAVFSRRGVTVKQSFSLNGDELRIRTVYHNATNHPVYYSDGDLALYLPFADSYEGSEICEKYRCHAHIAEAGENSFAVAERMGVSEYNLGVVFLKGDFVSYSQEGCTGNERGFFVLNVAAMRLLAGERYEVEAVVFPHKGGADFFEQAKRYPQFIRVEAKKGYTLFLGDTREMTLTAGEKIASCTVKCSGKKLPVVVSGKRATVAIEGKTLGEKRVEYEVNGRKGVALFNVCLPFQQLVKRRVDFIVKKQQCLDKKSPLYGAYLIYDNEEKRQYFSYDWTDHNANRERLGMALLITEYLRSNKDAAVEKSLALFKDFLLRECVNEETGQTFNNIGKDPSCIRLYNAPWVILFFCKYYELCGEKRYIELAVKMAIYYYENGGTKFYPNGVRFVDYLTAMDKGGDSAGCERVCALFDEHVQTIVNNSVCYPPHEVNFEQTIVTPATSLLLDKYRVSGDEFYLREAEKHLAILTKFDGMQADYRRHKIPIRYWDDFFFGKVSERTYGDTLHYWSVLSGYNYGIYGKLTGKKEWIEYGRQTIENCFALIKPNGTGACAYLLPAYCNGIKGKRYNSFANDQDFALYFASRFYKETK